MSASLVEILDALRAVTAAGIRVALPGRVERVHAGGTRVTVRVEQRLRRPGRDGAYRSEELPLLPDVPVLFPGTGRAVLGLRLEAEDPGLVVFADHALGSWLAEGALVDPPTPDAHGPAGAVFLPGLSPEDEAQALPSGSLEAVLGLRGSGARIEIEDGQVRALAGGSAVSLALKSDADALNARIDDVETTYNGHGHPVSGSAAGQTPAQSVTSATVAGTTIFKGQ